MNKPASIRESYERYGANNFYRDSGDSYVNPHEPQVIRALDESMRRWTLDLTNVLDLAAGSGEITLALRSRGMTNVSGIDPFTYHAFQRRTGQSAERFTFEQIAAGVLGDRTYSLLICSFAMHLCDKSRLPALAMQLSLIAPSLLIITPHKRPTIKTEWGWKLIDELTVQRIRARLYNSTHMIEQLR